MASIDYQMLEESKLRLVLQGRLDAETTEALWRQAVNKLNELRPHLLEIDASQIEYCDGAGIGLLLELKRRQEENKGTIQIVGLKPEFKQLMMLFDPGRLSKPDRQPASFRLISEQVGEATVTFWQDLRSQISFTGEVFVKLLNTALNPDENALVVFGLRARMIF